MRNPADKPEVVQLPSETPAAAPVINKVEPPDWAVEPETTTLRMLITGTNLAGATVHSTLQTGSATISQSGTHLFVDLSVPAHTAPGDYPLEISTPGGTAKAPFAIVPALNAAGRFTALGERSAEAARLRAACANDFGSFS